MNYYDGKIELEREVAALNAALAAERADCARAKESLDERCKTIIEQRTRIDFLDPYCKRLEEELAAEREKVVRLESQLDKIESLDDHPSLSGNERARLVRRIEDKKPELAVEMVWEYATEKCAEWAIAMATTPAPAKAAGEGENA